MPHPETSPVKKRTANRHLNLKHQTDPFWKSNRNKMNHFTSLGALRNRELDRQIMRIKNRAGQESCPETGRRDG